LEKGTGELNHEKHESHKKKEGGLTTEGTEGHGREEKGSHH